MNQSIHSGFFRGLIRQGFFLAAVFMACGSISCTSRSEGPLPLNRTVVIGLAREVNALTPIHSADVTTFEVNELIYPTLVRNEFDTARGVLEYLPSLARSWESAREGRDLVFHLRKDARWSDGKPIRAGDVQFTYALHANPDIRSEWQDALENLQRTANGRLDIKRAVEVRNDSTVVFHFARRYPGQLFDAGLMILPAHIFSSIPAGQLDTHRINRRPVGAGPFAVAGEPAPQEVVLVPNTTSRLPYPARVERLIFRTITDYRTRVMQLRNGEIDIMRDIELADIRRIERENPELSILALPPRRFHFIGWNNIDPLSWARGGVKHLKPHPLFGSPAVRRALTMAINRQDIARALLGPYSSPCTGPVSPMFPWAQNDSVAPLPFDPAAARAILAAEGWKDTNGDDILEKDGRIFSFVLRTLTGNVLWSEIATVVQQQLRAVKVEAIIQQADRNIFLSELIDKRYDAWILSFEVPLELQMDAMWHSDLELHPFNCQSYRNPAVDRLLRRIREVSNARLAAADLKQLQAIIARDQPVTFLFWEQGRIGVNRRITGIHSSVNSLTHEAWDWLVVSTQ